MRVLLLGGTGAMGLYLRDYLINRGEEVYITSRKKRQGNGRTHYVQGNAHNIVFLRHLLAEKWDAIVDFMIYDTTEFSERIGLLLSSTQQYIFISSSRVYSNYDSPITESTPRLLDVSKDDEFLLTEEYSLKKAREENILMSSENNNYTIIRPYITYSETRLQLGDLEIGGWLVRAIEGRSIVFSKDIAECKTTISFGKNVAKGISCVIGDKRTFGEIYNITDSFCLKWKDVLSIYLDALEKYTGKRPSVKWIEKSLKLSNPSTMYQVKYDRLFDREFDNSKILEIAPDLQFVSPYIGLSQCIKSFVDMYKKDYYPKISYMKEAYMDKLAGEHIRIKDIKKFKHKILYILCRYFGFHIEK